MASYNNNFVNEINKFINKTEQSLNSAISEPLLKTFKLIIDSWPVGDPNKWKISESQRRSIIASGYIGGRSRGDWRTALNQPNTTITSPPPTKPRAKELAYEEIISTINDVIENPDILYFSNSQHYATDLEDGYSSQMERNFVHSAASKLKSLIELEANKYGK